MKSESTNSFWKKISFGGNIGGGFGDPTFLDISPTIGYKLSDKFEMGLGPNYAYYRFKNDSFSADDHLYGGRVYGQFNLTKSIFARGELESIRVSFPDSGLAEAPVRREWQTVPLLGAGLQLKLLGLVNVQFTLLYNPLHDDDKSWRGTPWVTRLGFGF